MAGAVSCRLCIDTGRRGAQKQVAMLCHFRSEALVCRTPFSTVVAVKIKNRNFIAEVLTKHVCAFW